MKCPKCKREQPDGPECIHCGIVIEKYLAIQRRRAANGGTQTPGSPDGATEGTHHPRSAASQTLASGNTRLPPRGSTPRGRSPEGARRSPSDNSSGPRSREGATRPPLARRLHDLFVPLTKVRARFFESMVQFQTAGVSITEALATLGETARGRLGDLSGELRRSIDDGDSLASAMAKSSSFQPLHAGLADAGERTGRLDTAFQEAALLENERLLSFRTLVSRLVYPVVVLLLSTVIGPLPTLVFEGGGAYAVEVMGGAGLMLLWMGLAWTAYRLLVVEGVGLVARLPGVLERLFVPSRRSFFYGILHMGQKTGLGMAESLRLASGAWMTTDNRRLTLDTIRGIEKGGSLTASLGPLLPGHQHVILATAEKSGTLEEAFADLSRIYKTQAMARSKVMVTIASVLIVAVLALVMISGIMSGMDEAVEIPNQVFDSLNHELKGTGFSF